MHRDLWVTLTGYDHPPGAGPGPVSAVGSPRAPCLPAVGDLHHALVTVHIAVLALDIGGAADAADVPDIFVDEGVEALALRSGHLPSLHHHVAVPVIATRVLGGNMLSQEPLVHSILARGGLHKP